MIDKTLGIDVNLPTPEEFTQQLVKDTKNVEIIMACIEEYSQLYHQCAQYVINGEVEKAQEIREQLLK